MNIPRITAGRQGPPRALGPAAAYHQSVDMGVNAVRRACLHASVTGAERPHLLSRTVIGGTVIGRPVPEAAAA